MNVRCASLCVRNIFSSSFLRPPAPPPQGLRDAQLSTACWRARSAVLPGGPNLPLYLPRQSDSLGWAGTLNDGDRSQLLLSCRENTARAAVLPGHLSFPLTTRGQLGCDLASGQDTEWRRGGLSRPQDRDSHILFHNGWSTAGPFRSTIAPEFLVPFSCRVVRVTSPLYISAMQWHFIVT